MDADWLLDDPLVLLWYDMMMIRYGLPVRPILRPWTMLRERPVRPILRPWHIGMLCYVMYVRERPVRPILRPWHDWTMLRTIGDNTILM